MLRVRAPRIASISAGRTGELVATLGALTASAAAKVAIVASSAITLAGVTSASAASVSIAATATPSLSDVSLSSAGTIADSGRSATLSATLEWATSSATSTLALSGALSGTLADLTGVLAESSAPQKTIYQEIWIIEGPRPKAKERKKVKVAKKAIEKVAEAIEEIKQLEPDLSASLEIAKAAKRIDTELAVVRAQAALLEAESALARQIAEAEAKARAISEAAIQRAIESIERSAREEARRRYEEDMDDLDDLLTFMTVL